MPGARASERLVEVPLDILDRLDHEEAALATRVGRLQHCGGRHALEARIEVAAGGHEHVLRLRDPRAGEARAHRPFVGHRARDLDADARQAEGLRDGRSRKDGAVARNREHAVGAVLRARERDLLEVAEIHVHRHVGERKGDCLRITVDRDHAVSGRARMFDRSQLRHTRAEEQQSCHGRIERTPRVGA